jgi:hypothetical protein
MLLFVGTIWSLTYKQRKKDINRPIVIVVILLCMLSTAVSVSCFLNLLTSTDISQAHHRKHYSYWIRICEVSQHIPRRASGIPRRRYPTNVCTQACVIRLANFTCWWGGGRFIFLYLPIFRFNWCLFELLCLSRLLGFRFIAAMLFGDPPGLSFYQACCGAVSQVRTRSSSGSRVSWRFLKWLVLLGSTAHRNPGVTLQTSTPKCSRHGSRRFLPWRLPLTY